MPPHGAEHERHTAQGGEARPALHVQEEVRERLAAGPIITIKIIIIIIIIIIVIIIVIINIIISIIIVIVITIIIIMIICICHYY